MNDHLEITGTFEDVFRKILGGIAPARILDIATGEGSFINITRLAVRSDHQLHAADLHFGMLLKANSLYHAENTHFVNMHASQLGYPGEVFELVTCGVSLHHFQDPLAALRELWRVVTPDGHLLISEMYSNRQSASQMSEVYLHHWSADIDRLQGKVHNHTFTAEGITELLNQFTWHKIEVFDYARPITDEDPNLGSEEKIERVRSLVHERMKLAGTLANSHDLMKHGEFILDWIGTHGIERASILILLCQKMTGNSIEME